MDIRARLTIQFRALEIIYQDSLRHHIFKEKHNTDLRRGNGDKKEELVTTSEVLGLIALVDGYTFDLSKQMKRTNTYDRKVALKGKLLHWYLQLYEIYFLVSR
jgi:hypothetical protein